MDIVLTFQKRIAPLLVLTLDSSLPSKVAVRVVEAGNLHAFLHHLDFHQTLSVLELLRLWRV